MRKKILLILGIVLLLAITSILTVCSLLFEEKADLPVSSQDFPAVFSGMQKLNEHLRTAAEAPAGVTRRLTLTESEFNAMAGSFVTNPFLFFLTGNKMPDFLTRSRISAKKSILHIYYAHDAGKIPVFGRYINLRIRMKASAAKGSLTFAILSCRAGSIRIPAVLAEKILQSSMRKQYDNTPVDRILRGGAVSLNFRNGTLILEYQPKELIDSADLNLYGSVNNRVRKAAESYGGRKNGSSPFL